MEASVTQISTDLDKKLGLVSKGIYLSLTYNNQVTSVACNEEGCGLLANG